VGVKGFALLWLVVTASRPFPWEQFVQLYYVADAAPYSDGYPRKATNRFRLWDADVTLLLPPLPSGALYVSHNGVREVQSGDRSAAFVPSDGFNKALAEFLECRPDLAPYGSEIYVSERIEGAEGSMVSAFLFRSLGNTRTDAASYLHLVTFVYRTAAGCASTGERPAKVDTESRASVDEHGGYDRRVWDVVPVGGRLYVLALQNDYEYRCFQVYQLAGALLVPVAHVGFSCLGCQ
jgi:hypothetical protein